VAEGLTRVATWPPGPQAHCHQHVIQARVPQWITLRWCAQSEAEAVTISKQQRLSENQQCTSQTSGLLTPLGISGRVEYRLSCALIPRFHRDRSNVSKADRAPAGAARNSRNRTRWHSRLSNPVPDWLCPFVLPCRRQTAYHHIRIG